MCDFPFRSPFLASSCGESPVSSDEFEFSGIRRSRSSVPFMFPPVATQQQVTSLQRKHSTPAESRITPYASNAIAAVNRIADRLKRLNRAPDVTTSPDPVEEAEEEVIVSDILQIVAGLRQSTLSNVPARFRQKLAEESSRADGSTEHAILLGRCFNLSMNLKILSQSTVLDPSIAGRVLSDLSVLENSMRLRGKEEEEVSSLMTRMTLDRNKGSVHAGVEADGRPRLGFL